MKRKIVLLMGLCVILCAFVLARKGAVFVQSEQAKSAPACIVVDAGHGGDDTKHRCRTVFRGRNQ